MRYDFDRVIDRSGTDAVKYDLLKPLFGADDIIPMWVADMDFAVADFIRDAVIKRAEHEIYGYTLRSDRFSKAVAGWISRRHGWEVDPSSIEFSPGVVPALVLSLLAFTEAGDKVLVQSPVYFPFFSTIEDHGRVLVNNQLCDTDGTYTIDFDDLERQFSSGVKMMMFCHPHNPVGRVWSKEELIRLAELAVKYDVLILSDEIHSDLLLFGHKHFPLANLGPEIAARTVSCFAPSKTFNLAGLHSSAVVIENPQLMKKYKRTLEKIHVGGGNLFGAVALEAAYNNGDAWLDELLTYLEQNYLFLKNYLEEKMPFIRVTPIEATYLAWLHFGSLGIDDAALMKFMVQEAKIGLNDGPRFGPGGEQYLRMNIAAPKAIVRKALEQMTAALERHFPEKF